MSMLGTEMRSLVRLVCDAVLSRLRFTLAKP